MSRGQRPPATPGATPGGGENHAASGHAGAPPVYAAIDLGTNNCRLLIAAPRGRGLRVVDAFSRIVRLGEGVATAGALSDAAMARCIDALKVCADKMIRRRVTRKRCIATQACRAASNGEAFLERVRAETGLVFDVITTEEEARLAARGCADLVDPDAEAAIVFDIGGGSTEISFLDDVASGTRKPSSWLSMPIGVVNLSERWNGREMTAETYESLVQSVCEEIGRARPPADIARVFERGAGHLLGTSGTVTSLAGVHLGLERYRRDAVDGLWLTAAEARGASERLRAMSYEARRAEPCIGEARADLVVCGCAILEALLRVWPATRIRVADRGLREGILAGLMEADRRKARRRRGAKRGPKGGSRRRRKGAQQRRAADAAPAS